MDNGIHDYIVETADAISTNYGLNMFNAEDALKILSDKDGALQEAINIAIADAGFEGERAEHFRKFVEHGANEFVTEAAAAVEVKPYASFQISLMKELFSRSIANKLIRQEVIDSTSHKFGTFRSVLIDSAGNRHYLNEITTETDINEGWKEETLTLPASKEDLFSTSRLSAEEQAVQNKRLDVKTSIVEVTLSDGTNTVKVPVDGAFNEYGSINLYVEGELGGATVKDRVYGIIDFKTGIVSLSSEDGKVTEAVIKYRLSNVYAEINDLEIELEYTEDRVDIDDGTPINLSIPMNYLSDIKAYTTVDGLSLAVEKISTAYGILDDRKILRKIAEVADANTNNHVDWDYTLPSGVTRIDWNAGLLEAMNRAIALSDEATQFQSITAFNLAVNPVDASTLTSPVLLNQPSMTQPSVVSGSFNFNTSALVSPAGTVNIVSTKQVKRDNIYVVPMTSSEDERVISDFQYSSILLTDGSYRNRKAPNIKNIVARERRELKVFEGNALSKINIIHS